MYMYMYMNTSVVEPKHCKATTPKNSSSFQKRMSRLRWDSNLHILRTRQMFYQLSYQSSPAGQAESLSFKQGHVHVMKTYMYMNK